MSIGNDYTNTKFPGNGSAELESAETAYRQIIESSTAVIKLADGLSGQNYKECMPRVYKQLKGAVKDIETKTKKNVLKEEEKARLKLLSSQLETLADTIKNNGVKKGIKIEDIVN